MGMDGASLWFWSSCAPRARSIVLFACVAALA
jgi:hypothetical protein